MRAGRLQERIAIQSATDAADGAGQLIRTWANYRANWPAEHIDVSGGEVHRGRQISAQASHLFKIRTIDDVTTAMRVVWDSTNYGIVHIANPFPGETWLECKEAD